MYSFAVLTAAQKIFRLGARVQLDLRRLVFRAEAPDMQAGYEFFLQRVDVRNRAIVGRTRLLASHIGGGNDVQLMSQVIEGKQPVVEHEDAIRQLEVIFCVGRQALEVTHRIIGKVADSAGRKRWKTGGVRRFVLTKSSSQYLEQTGILLFDLLPAAYNDFLAAATYHHVRTDSEKCVTSDALTAFNRLQ